MLGRTDLQIVVECDGFLWRNVVVLEGDVLLNFREVDRLSNFYDFWRIVLLDGLALHIDNLNQFMLGQVVEILPLLDLQLRAFGEIVPLDHKSQVVMEYISDAVAVLIAQQLMHVIVFQRSYLH